MVSIPGEIKRTNRLFVSLRSMGQCDENGKAVLKIDYGSEKFMASPDKPLMLLAALTESCFRLMRYSSEAAAEDDIVKFKAWAMGLNLKVDS